MLKPRKKILITLISIFLIIPLPIIFGREPGKSIANQTSTSSTTGRLDHIRPDAGQPTFKQGFKQGRQLDPLQDLLNRDGSLDLHRGYSGSLDVEGWDMVLTGNREPRFVRKPETQEQALQAQPGITAAKMTWDNRFARPGVDSVTTVPRVWSVAVSGNDVYVGGEFDRVGGAEVNNIARWDGVNWSAMGDGVDDEVRAIIVKDTDVYAGGHFKHAGSVAASSVAKWNGTSWSALGDGIPRTCFGCGPTVICMAVSGADLYVGGWFDAAGAVAVHNIAKWDGKTWLALGNGYPAFPGFAPVATIAVIGSNVFAGGSFGLFKWDGAIWSAVGTDFSGQVGAMIAIGSDLYASGLLSVKGNPARLAKWDGAQWSALASGVNITISSLAAVGTDLYAAGQFTSGGGSPVTTIAKWNGANWSPASDGVKSDIDDRTVYVYNLASNGSDLYVVGDFVLAGGLVANRVAKWNGAAWSVLGNGPGSSVEAILANGNDIYAGGVFRSAGGTRANAIARWDGTTWSAFGAGITFEVKAMALSGGKLYAGGAFSTAGDVSASNIAVWDGAKWSALGAGITGCNTFSCTTSVRALVIKGTDLYVGGKFTGAGGVPASNIAKWDGASWSALGSGIDGDVNVLALVGNDLYAAGFFSSAGGVSASSIARWNGTTWSAVGSGIDNVVYALAASGSNLYVGGGFKKAGGLTANNIAGWNGSSWFVLGSGIESTVLALAASGGNLYAGGIFASAGGISAKDIARWNGSEWSALGGGVGYNENIGSVSAIAIAGGDVYVGGSFTYAGDKVSYSFARWFAAAVAPPKITSASVRGKKLFVLGENFDDGAVILLNGEAQKTRNDDDTPDSRLIGKKAGNKITPGDKLQVQNPNGLLSAEFTFTGE